MRLFVLLVAIAVTLVPALFAQDPAEVDSKHYAVELENEHVRVLRVTYPPGETSVMHGHPPLVAISLSGGQFQMALAGGGTVEIPPLESGTVLWDPATIHQPKNVADDSATLLLVELKQLGAEQANVALLRSAYEAFGRGDVPAVVGIMDPEIEWIEAEGFPYAGTYVGPDAVVENVFMRLGTEWTSYTVEPQQFLAEDDRVVVLGEYRGTYGETGKSFVSPFAHSWRLDNGKVVHFRQFTDTDPVQRAMLK